MKDSILQSRIIGLKILSVLLTAVFLISLSSCSRKNKNEFASAEESFRKAMAKFEKGKYLDASETLVVITLNFSGSSVVDSAQYYLGECHYRMKEYIVASSEYERLIDHYPYSPLVEQAKYKIGMCYYELSPHYGLDQEFSQKCVDEFQEFTEDYPDSELIPEVLEKIFEIRSKLAKKVFRSGYLYFKLHDYESALVYFDRVLEFYYDTEYAPKALLRKGESYLKMKKKDEGFVILQRLLEKYPESPESATAKELMNPQEKNGFLFW